MAETALPPFITCQHHDGPYDTESFGAGWEAGTLDSFLVSYSHRAPAFDWDVYPDNLPFIDLVAMRHGWTVTKVADIDRGRIAVRLTPSARPEEATRGA